MPWTADDAPRKTKLATNAKLREQWAAVANRTLEETGDEGLAVRTANGVIKREAEHREMAKDGKK